MIEEMILKSLLPMLAKGGPKIAPGVEALMNSDAGLGQSKPKGMMGTLFSGSGGTKIPEIMEIGSRQTEQVAPNYRPRVFNLRR